MSGDHNMHCSANQPSLREAAQQALEALEYYQHRDIEWEYSDEAAIAALRAALAQQEQSPCACWRPISEPCDLRDVIDIRMADGSVLCAVLPQLDGDLWWKGAGTGEKFIDPTYANVTHWRPHAEGAEREES